MNQSAEIIWNNRKRKNISKENIILRDRKRSCRDLMEVLCYSAFILSVVVPQRFVTISEGTCFWEVVKPEMISRMLWLIFS